MTFVYAAYLSGQKFRSKMRNEGETQSNGRTSVA